MQEQRSNLNSPTSTKEIEFVDFFFPRKRSPDPDGYAGELYQTFKNEKCQFYTNSSRK